MSFQPDMFDVAQVCSERLRMLAQVIQTTKSEDEETLDMMQ